MNKITYLIILTLIVQGCNTLNYNESNSLEGEKKVILEKDGQEESNSTTINSLKISLMNLQSSHKNMKNTYELDVLPNIEDLISKINNELN